MTWTVYRSTNSRANLATCNDPVADEPLLLSRGGRSIALVPTYVEERGDGTLRVVSAQITLFLRKTDG